MSNLTADFETRMCEGRERTRILMKGAALWFAFADAEPSSWEARQAYTPWAAWIDAHAEGDTRHPNALAARRLVELASSAAFNLNRDADRDPFEQPAGYAKAARGLAA